MKRFISIVLGLAAWISTTFGQGYIAFDSYNNSVLTTFGAGVTGHSAGQGLNSGWTAGLLYSTSPVIDGATTNSAGAGASLNGVWSVAPNTAVYQASAFGLAGYYVGPDFILSDGVDGQVVYFEVITFETGAPGTNSAEKYANSIVRGHSASFTGVLHSFSNQPFNMDNMQPFSVFTIPEPSTLALAGLGLTALMAYRRKRLAS